MFDMPREEVLDTLLHETHHAYVHKAVQSADWNDTDSYYNNPIEVAAREYAEEWGPKYLQYADSI